MSALHPHSRRTWNIEIALDRPILRQIFPKRFVFRIVTVLGAQALKRRNDFLLSYLHRVGDHARGLFEAEASIAVSAAHALQNVQLVCFFCHWTSPPNRLIGYTGKTDLLRRDRFRRCFRHTFGVHDYPNPNKDAPCGR